MEASANGQPEKDPRQAQQIMKILDSLSRRLERVQEALAQATGLRPHTYALLRLVASTGQDGIVVSDAALRLGVRPQALSVPITELGNQGLLQRTKDPTDGRARRLQITPAGTQRLALGDDLEKRLFHEVLTQVPAANVAGLILGRLDTALGRAVD